MTKKLEEEFNLPPLEEAIEQETVTEEKPIEETVTEIQTIEDAISISEKINNALNDIVIEATPIQKASQSDAWFIQSINNKQIISIVIVPNSIRA